MGTTALNGLLEYLYGTLSPDHMLWVGEHLIERAKTKQQELSHPFTMKEIDNMLDEAESAFQSGDYLTNDEVFQHNINIVAE